MLYRCKWEEREEMIESVDEYQIVKNVINHTIGLRNSSNWKKVQVILLNGTGHSGMTSSCVKAMDLGVDPYGYKWEKEADINGNTK